jgi:hypothetical protein
MFESECGRYRVEVRGKNIQILAKKDDSPFFVPQVVLFENLDDLSHLFTAIGAVLNQMCNGEQIE